MIENYFQNVDVSALSQIDREKVDLYLKIAELDPINWKSPNEHAVQLAIGFIRAFDNNPIVAAKKVCFSLEKASDIAGESYKNFLNTIDSNELTKIFNYEKETGKKHPVLEDGWQKSSRKADKYLAENLHCHIYDYLDKLHGLDQEQET